MPLRKGYYSMKIERGTVILFKPSAVKPHRRPARVYMGLDEIIVSKLGRIPISSRELYQRVLDDFGHVERRHFFIYLKRLRESGEVAAEVEYHGRGNPWFRYMAVSPSR